MVPGTQLLDILLNGLTIGMVYVLVAAGLSLVFGVMDVLNLAHGELLALGAYFAFSLVTGFDGGGFWIALIAVPLLVGAVGAVTERGLINRVYGRGQLAQILLTFGLLLIIYDLKRFVWGTDPLFYSPPAVIDRTITVLGFSYSGYSYFIIAAGGLLAAAVWAALNHTRVGLVVRAGSEDREMVRNLGVDIDRYYTVVFGAGAALAAFGGVVLGGYQNVSLEMGNAVIIPAFVIVVLGGLGSFRGAVAGGLLVGIVQSAVSTLLPTIQGVVIFLLMIGVLLVRPQGLFGGTGEGVSAGRSEPSEFVGGLGGGVLTGRGRSRLGVAAVVLLALVPVFSGVIYSGFVVSLLITVLIWALFAMSLDIVLGYTGLISLGHALFYGLGAYATLLTLLYVSPSAFVALGVALATTAITAWVVGHVAIRVSGVYFVMITLAFAEIVRQVVVRADVTGGSSGLFGAPEPLYGIGGVGIRFDEVLVGVEPLLFTGDALFYYFLLAIVVASYLGVSRMMAAPFGTVLRAIRESELRARFVGYEVRSVKRQAFVVSSTLAGLSGALFALYNGFAAPDLLNWINSGNAIIMVVLGGSGTLYGPMIGAAVFTLIERQLSAAIPWWRLLLGTLFVVVVLFLPKGLISLPARLGDDRAGVGGPPASAEEVEPDD
ncbi:ABC transporter permease [Halobellus ruber]|uniref:ABC transporter permease n=1 Tax=Halobellus ruber TaxID=2761102 RepID=A0A7J9SHV2_9EURY|nr:ABC transporter permease [Halobellus ruber]MBB6645586.1 ABC transporter permease [Halobellus ruber]